MNVEAERVVSLEMVKKSCSGEVKRDGLLGMRQNRLFVRNEREVLVGTNQKRNLLEINQEKPC